MCFLCLVCLKWKEEEVNLFTPGIRMHLHICAHLLLGPTFLLYMQIHIYKISICNNLMLYTVVLNRQEAALMPSLLEKVEEYTYLQYTMMLLIHK